jgi:hypothetical protein
VTLIKELLSAVVVMVAASLRPSHAPSVMVATRHDVMHTRYVPDVAYNHKSLMCLELCGSRQLKS